MSSLDATLPAMTKEQFLQRVQQDGSKCWVWLQACDKDGYGRTYHQRTAWKAHRLAWLLFRGPIPDGLCVLHHCDNPPCCNPTHLFLGTDVDNVRDMVKKGRQAVGDRNASRLYPERRPRGATHWTAYLPERVARGERSGRYTRPERTARGDRNGMRTHPESVSRGEKAGNSKLTDVSVLAIRRLFAGGGLSYADLGRQFGVTGEAIRYIIKRKTWTHLPETSP